MGQSYKTLIAAASMAFWQLVTPPFARADELLVSAAISMKEALLKIATGFERAHPGTHVVLNCASSGVIEQQVKHGAPVDVLITAGVREMTDLAGANLLIGQPRIFAYNRLVIVVPKGSRKYKDISQLIAAHRIALGSPASVPAGHYAVQALQNSGTYAAVKSKLAYFQNVREVLTFVESGNVDAGFVYQSDASHSKNAAVSCLVPRTLTAPIAYEIAQTKTSTHDELAKSFIDLVMDSSSNAVFDEYQFQRQWQ